jgi:hypothetical protein
MRRSDAKKGVSPAPVILALSLLGAETQFAKTNVHLFRGYPKG